MEIIAKDVYGDSLDDLRPDFTRLLKEIPFREAKKTGRDFVQPVMLTQEQGFTYGQGVQTLVTSIDADGDDAKVRGNSLTLRTTFSYDAAANMASSKGAFITATKYRFKNMMKSASARLESQILYGGISGGGLGITSGTANASSTSTVATFTAATWAPGIWSGAEGATLDIYNTGGPTKINTNAVLSITAIDHANKAITVSGNAADIAAIDAFATNTGAGLTFFWAGAYGKEMVGLRSIASNTGSLYGIAGGSYSLWQGNTFAVGGADLTLKKVLQGNAVAAAKGLMEDSVVLVSSKTFANLANDQASLRRYSGEVKKATDGFAYIQFYAPSGVIDIIPHPMVKEGEAISYPKKRAERIGASDITFNTPGGEGGEMFKHLANETGYEVRLYSEQAIFLPAPAECIYFSGIVNS